MSWTEREGMEGGEKLAKSEGTEEVDVGEAVGRNVDLDGFRLREAGFKKKKKKKG